MLAKATIEMLKSQNIDSTALAVGDYVDPSPVDANGNPGGIYNRSWQIDPLNPEVEARVLDYVLSKFNELTDKIRRSVQVTPNDGRGFSPNFATGTGGYDTSDHQLITDVVFTLDNNIAQVLEEQFPDKYISIMT